MNCSLNVEFLFLECTLSCWFMCYVLSWIINEKHTKIDLLVAIIGKTESEVNLSLVKNDFCANFSLDVSFVADGSKEACN